MDTPVACAPLTRAAMVAYVQQVGERYWPLHKAPADARDAAAHVPCQELGRQWVSVALPPRYAAWGVDGALWVDAAAVPAGSADAFAACDWFLAAFSYLAGMAEWHHEAAHGPVHSFALRLPQVPVRCYEHAWANRILLLLRALEAERLGVVADSHFGPLPKAEILLTHDVDALDKTWPIRLKQTAFEAFNVLRFMLQAKPGAAWKALKAGARMLLRTPRYDHLGAMADMVAAHGLRSRFHLHMRRPRRSWRLWLMDPGYPIADARLKAYLAHYRPMGFEFGLHPSFDAWADAAWLRAECEAMQQVFGLRPSAVRQHWLRFSWRDTWRAQSAAGLTEDTTLGFNDRTGFRTATALRYHPWDVAAGQPHRIAAVPMIAMDSHFYAYQSMDAAARRLAMQALIAEVQAVHGVASVLWHPHTLAPDYGWQEGFRDLLACISHDQTNTTIPR